MNKKPTRSTVLKQLSELNARWVNSLVARGATTDEYGQPTDTTPAQEDQYLLAVQRVLRGEGVGR